MSFKCQIFTTRLTFHNVLELSCDVRIIILFSLIAILPPNIKCAKLPNPQIRLLINDEDLLHEKTSRHEAGGGNVQPEHSGEHFNLYRSELKRLSYETIHRILRDENEPSYRREDTELRYYQKRSPSAYEESHQLIKRSTAAEDQDQDQDIALNYSKRRLKEFIATPQLEKELHAASSLDLSDNRLTAFCLSLLNDHIHTLNLSNNSFTSIPLSENTTLKSLNLNGNSIRESALPSNVYLHNLYLSSNSIENLSAVNLSLLKNLEILDISCNRLKSLETSFFPERMHNLKHLNLAHNQLGTIYRETFYNLLSLNTLLLAHNNITDIDYETFLALPNLQYLDLSFNRLKGKSIRALQGITGLVALNIAFNAELGPYMQEFVASWSLKELDASGTGLCQIPAALAQSVRSLKLTHNWLKVINCGDLDSYPLLQYLDLSFSHIELIEDDALGRLEILEVLMLDHNQLSKIPLSLPVSLEQLFLQNNNIMDIQSQSFQGLGSLKTLDLSHNKLLYLPDIALPKLQTLSLQSAEIRGISQGIVHTLPRLNELFLEDNPIKCSDLLGIAEWASTCRLRSTKDEVTDNEGGELVDEEESQIEGKVELKRKFEKMHNFYDKFEGEHCQKHKRLQEMATKPLCAVAEEEKPIQIMKSSAHQLETNLERTSVAAGEEANVENFKLNSMIAIPLPAKKAVKTLTETANKTTATADDGVNVARAKPITSAPVPPPLATAMKIEGNPMLNNNNNSKSFMLTKTSSVTRIAATPTATPTATATAPAEARQTFEEFAFKDKPQEHYNKAKKTFAKTTTADVASVPGTAATLVKGIAIEMADKATIAKELHQKHVVGVVSTSAESLRAANLQETLKQNVPESIIKKDIKRLTRITATVTTTATTTTQLPPATATTSSVDISTAINSPKPETATTMPTETITATTLSSTTLGVTASPSTAAATATSVSKINLFKENIQNEKEIKTKIGPTKEIKSFEISTIASSPVLPPASTTSPALAIVSSQTSLPNATFDVSSPSYATNKELNVSTTSRTPVVVQAIAAQSISYNIPAIASTPTITIPRTTATLPTRRTRNDGDATIILGLQQPTSPSTSITTETAASTAMAATKTSASLQDKNLASNNDNNIGQDNGQDNWYGQDNKKTLVTLHITTPITPHIVLQSNETQPPEKDTHPQHSQHQQRRRQEARQVQADVEHENAAIQHQSLKTTSNDVNAVKCMQSNSIECTSFRPQRHEMKEAKGRDIGKMPAMNETISETTNEQTPIPTQTMAFSTTTTMTAAVKIAATAKTSVAATSSKPTASESAPSPATTHKHEPLQLHIKDRHLIGTPLLMHKGDNLLVPADELIKPNSSQDPHKVQMTIPPTTPASSTAALSSSPETETPEFIRKTAHTLDKSQNHKFQEPKISTSQRHHEPLEHKGETIKDKDYVQYKKSNADMKTKKPSLIMKKMTIITTKQHAEAAGEEKTHARDENEIHHQKDLMADGHYQELKPLHQQWDEGPSKHSTVNTPINKKSSLQNEPQTFQHELLLQQLLHDQQQQQHGKASQSEQWSDLRRTTEKENHPGLILLVSSGLFVVLLLGLMHVYRCDVPWRRQSPTHHLRPHQRHTGSLDDDVHSFLSYNEGMQKWHHSTRLEAPYSSPLHNLHVRELQKTSATEKAATFKAATSYKDRHLNRSHILPRTNSQSSTATTRTTSPSSSAILDDETFYIEMTPSTGQFAQALQSELLPMELLNMAQTTKYHETKETSADYQFAQEEDAADYNVATSSSFSTNQHHVTARSDLLAATSSASATSNATNTTTSAALNNHSNKTLYNTRKFGLW